MLKIPPPIQSILSCAEAFNADPPICSLINGEFSMFFPNSASLMSYGIVDQDFNSRITGDYHNYDTVAVSRQPLVMYSFNTAAFAPQ